MAATTSLHPPSRTVGRYTLIGELASGGMATVHLGRMDGPAGFSLTVAIKRLHQEFASQDDFTEMLFDEARLAGRVRHPNVVPIIDVVDDQGELSLVMEYVRGESLAALFSATRKKKACVPPAIASAIVLGVLEGLHAAHEARGDRGEALGIVHRDVSPQNVIVGADGIPRVLDFGIAKAAGRLHQSMSGTVKGKSSYMSPEQARGRALDRRTDVYAAGVVLWETLTGRRLFTGPHHVAILMKVFDEIPTAPSAVVPGLPPGLDAVILRALAKSPDDRYATAKEFALAIEEVLPPASPRLVSEWVLGLAAGALASRARLEEDATLLALPTPVRSGGRAPRGDVRSVTATTVDARSGSRPRARFVDTRAWLVVLAGLLLVASFVLVVRRASYASAAAHDAMTAAPPLTATAPPLTAMDPPVVLPPSPPVAAEPATSAPVLTTDPVRPAATGAARRRAGPRPAASSNPKPACEPPYRMDDQGIQVPKPECF